MLLGDGAQRLVSTVFGDRAARERYAAEEQMAVQMGFQAEFSHRDRRTWWDSLVDGLNRLPRPLMTFGVIGLFVWAVVDPPAFSLAMLALQNVPEMLWYIFLAVIGFWFGTKMIEKAPRRMEGPTAEDVKRVHDIEAERRYQEDMADTSKPLTNAAIVEWNRRRKRGSEAESAASSSLQ
jgi:hypothetical protein